MSEKAGRSTRLPRHPSRESLTDISLKHGHRAASFPRIIFDYQSMIQEIDFGATWDSGQLSCQDYP